MEKMRVLVANEPRTYREVLVDALRVLRPQVEVSAVASYDLAAEIERLRPHLVVCSWLSTAMPVGPLSWVVLYPHEENGPRSSPPVNTRRSPASGSATFSRSSTVRSSCVGLPREIISRAIRGFRP